MKINVDINKDNVKEFIHDAGWFANALPAGVVLALTEETLKQILPAKYKWIAKVYYAGAFLPTVAFTKKLADDLRPYTDEIVDAFDTLGKDIVRKAKTKAETK